MEICLNLAWTMLAIASFCLWMRFEDPVGTRRRSSIVALAMLLVILFPVISVSDDLWSIQNPAETDTCQRRNQIAPDLHSVFPVLAAPPAILFCHVNPDVRFFFASINLPAPVLAIPALEEIENRPPPTA
jgi:hypothetical protein